MGVFRPMITDELTEVDGLRGWIYRPGNPPQVEIALWFTTASAVGDEQPGLVEAPRITTRDRFSRVLSVPTST